MQINGHPFPDFFVIGAQKSGTTSLCAWLEQHPDVYFSKPKEPMLLSRDEIDLHPHFFAERPHSWEQFRWPDALYHYDAYLKGAPETALMGDGSTSYLYSQLAPRRLAEVHPQAKLIVILRDPALRSYSAYQHYLRYGSACEDFAKHLRYENGLTLQGSDYVRHLRHWLQYFPREQFLFLLYEALHSQRDVIEQTLQNFLGLSRHSLGLIPRENASLSVRSDRLQLFLNRRLRRQGHIKAAVQQEQTPPPDQGVIAWLRARNLSPKPYAPMPLEIRRRLNRHFRNMNADLPALTGLEVEGFWYHDAAGTTPPTP